MNKTDYIWLTRHTEISNMCASVEECDTSELVLRLYRKHHLGQLQKIFVSYETECFADADDYLQVKVKAFTVTDFYECARNFQADMLFNQSDGRIYYVPVDKVKYRRIFNKLNPRFLANLPTEKKLNILMSFGQACYFSVRSKEKSEKALSQKTDKLLALLQMKIPPAFIDDEIRKVRLITAEIAKLPHIVFALENFEKLPFRQQRNLLKKTSEITAKYNRITPPEMQFLTKAQIYQEEGVADWADTDAFAYGKKVVINRDKLKIFNGVQALSLAWHETTHVAQETGDYSSYPLVEEMFNQNLDYLQKMPETYLFHPQEQVVFALEKQFIENLVKYTQSKTKNSVLNYDTEYDVTIQYLYRSMQRKL